MVEIGTRSLGPHAVDPSSAMLPTGENAIAGIRWCTFFLQNENFKKTIASPVLINGRGGELSKIQKYFFLRKH